MKNNFEIRGDYAAIFLNRKNGSIFETIISKRDLKRAQELDGTWYANWRKSSQSFYVHGNTLGGRGRRKVGLLLHRWIMDCPDGLEIDHINHDTLNNTRENIRIVTHHANLLNRREEKLRSTNTTGYKGISFHKASSKWRVQKRSNGKVCHYGEFSDFSQALQASLSMITQREGVKTC